MIQKPTWPQLSQFFALLKSIQHIILHRKRIFEYIFYEVIILDNFNIDENTMNKLNSMLNNGNIKDMLSQIPPDTLKNFSSMINNNTSQSNNHTAKEEDANSNTTSTQSSSGSSNNFNNFDFSNIDMNTIMKMKSVMEKMNHSSDPRSNLLQSLKPYLREEKKSKLDQYSNLLNMTTLIELFNQNNGKENSSEQ